MVPVIFRVIPARAGGGEKRESFCDAHVRYRDREEYRESGGNAKRDTIL